MDATLITSLGKIGSAGALALAAIGSAAGTGVAAMAAVGAWKKCYEQNKAAPFMLVAFIGAPLSQTIYGMILCNKIIASSATESFPALIAAGVIGGTAMATSAYMQGKAGAGCSVALAETGKGFGNYLMAIGVVETVAIFVLVFMFKVIAAAAPVAG
ncbi:MAG: V-type ATP synthase subunit K [Kiritimatiellae bacterium]|jgi:V/A-type H+-transporting ATPase subunit K|nr:V-type ATP synthase subunit K [Kiritimatiellia bacterium]